MPYNEQEVPELDSALKVVRGVWKATGQGTESIERPFGEAKVCKRMVTVGFDGMAEDGDVRSAWRSKLDREGKLRPGASTLRDLVLGADPAP